MLFDSVYKECHLEVIWTIYRGCLIRYVFSRDRISKNTVNRLRRQIGDKETGGLEAKSIVNTQYFKYSGPSFE